MNFLWKVVICYARRALRSFNMSEYKSEIKIVRRGNVLLHFGAEYKSNDRFVRYCWQY